MKRKFLLFIVLNIFVVFPTYSQLHILPKIMYVTSKEGLRVRSVPSTNGEIVGTLQYGERVIVKSRNTARWPLNGIGPDDIISTIDEVYDYWYRLDDSHWVFGGYLSEVLPPDAPIVLGVWENVPCTELYIFSPNNSFQGGFAFKGGAWYGKWRLNGNQLIIVMDTISPDSEPLRDIDRTEVIEIQIIDRNHIILNYQPDENYPNRKIVKLIRSDIII
ncbi:MAG: SH3 domain-containing protein [Spirochaetaceae bacterium]|jgi:hypothetical protein|nr:SH3 domain-containing protein [Spirochaetaceae bacterium]